MITMGGGLQPVPLADRLCWSRSDTNNSISSGKARQTRGKARQSEAERGKARQSEAKRGKARQSEAKRSKAR